MIKTLTSNILIYGGTNAVKSLIPFLMLPILTMYISPKEYGELALIETTILFLLPSSMGLAQISFAEAYDELNSVDIDEEIDFKMEELYFD